MLVQYPTAVSPSPQTIGERFPLSMPPGRQKKIERGTAISASKSTSKIYRKFRNPRKKYKKTDVTDLK